ncbi:MAG: hypothetical protein JWM91_4181 [Rhodospirillales bacterium]|nr:hypothetical protein [Rhodospirillales bacterium]
MDHSDIAALEKALSLERFSRYLAWANGDRARAVELYTLNTRLSEALYTPLQALEVSLRNRIHTVISEAVNDHWFDEPEFQKGRQAEQLEKAKADLAEERKPAEPGRVVAALTFGYWTGFFGAAYDAFWRDTLYQIAIRPNGKRLSRKDFSKPITPIRILRNRIAHHEPILGWNLPEHHNKILELTDWLSPPAANWCRGISSFAAVYPEHGVELHSV